MKKFGFLNHYLNECNNLCRVGGYRDGGYVLPYSAIINSEVLISGGVGSTARFEVDILDINQKIKIIPIDYSFSKIRMFARTLYHYFKKGANWKISLLENITVLILIKRFKVLKKKISKNYTLIDIEKDSKTTLQKHIIKLDIEGSEYEILESILLLEKNILGLCVEFHDLNDNKNLKRLKDFLRKTTLKLIFVSINEGSIEDGVPSILELSFAAENNLLNKQNYLQASFNPGHHDLVVFNKY